MTHTSSLMLISSSYVCTRPREYLGYCKDELTEFLPTGSRVLFVPFAYPDYSKYTDLVRSTFAGFRVSVVGAHETHVSSVDSLRSRFDVVFCGGGNTFLLLRELYSTQLVPVIRTLVEAGMRYMGSSAGANVACPTIGTTNDMPIVQPPSHEGLGLIPFNINPHYYERPQGFEHMGETRRGRIHEFLTHNAVPVLALREGAILRIEAGQARLLGLNGGILFRRGTDGAPDERPVDCGESVSFLLT